MPVSITLPNQFVAKHIFRLVGAKIWSLPALPSRVEFDFSNLGFVRPCGIVFLSNLTKYLEMNECDVRYVGLNYNKASIKFLDDAQFFAQHLGAPLSEQNARRPTTQPLVEVRSTEALPWVDMTLMPWLTDCTNIHANDMAEFATCMKELFNNISDHTNAGLGSIFAQWFPNECRAIVSIADFGPGIPTTARRVDASLSDAAAIERAFEDGFTAKSHPNNQGVGLHYLKQNVVDNMLGSLTVHSGTGELSIRKTGNSARFMPYEGRGFCPGTLFNIVFRTDLIERATTEEAFEW